MIVSLHCYAGDSHAGSTKGGQHSRLLLELDPVHVLEDGAFRARSEPERYADSEHSTFTDYERAQLGVRHYCITDKDIDAARSTEPALSAELEALFARLRAAASDPTGSDPVSELVGEMERAAAMTLHAALLECMRASGTNEETSHI